MSYWDTSALVKLYAKEPDSTVFETHVLKTPSQPAISRIGLYEARAAFHRKEAEGVLQAGASQTLYDELLLDTASEQLRLIELDSGVEQEYGRVLSLCYQQSPPIALRTLDGLHLASARVANETEVVATDKRLREAARVLGFSLFPP